MDPPAISPRRGLLMNAALYAGMAVVGAAVRCRMPGRDAVGIVAGGGTLLLGAAACLHAARRVEW